MNYQDVRFKIVRKKQRIETPCEIEFVDLRSLSGEIVWIGCGMLLQSVHEAFKMQQNLPHLNFKEIID